MKPSIDELFEHRMSYPDVEAQSRFARLVGLDDHKARLSKMLGLLINPIGLEQWADRFHPDANGLLNAVLRRPPLVILAGDVGSGKTALAESVGDAVARQENIDIALFPLSLSTRGQGRVGEMTQLISSAFEHTIHESSKLKGSSKKARGGILLLVDEADAIAQSRETVQMHHEDRAGVNAFIRGVDRIANNGLPAAVIMCTNRLAALDPAIKRRAADILLFGRPNEAQRHAALMESLGPLGFNKRQVSELVLATGPKSNREYGLTYSDITQRLFPAIVLDAYPNGAVNPERAIEIARGITPTPPFNENLS